MRNIYCHLIILLFVLYFYHRHYADVLLILYGADSYFFPNKLMSKEFFIELLCARQYTLGNKTERTSCDISFPKRI